MHTYNEDSTVLKAVFQQKKILEAKSKQINTNKYLNNLRLKMQLNTERRIVENFAKQRYTPAFIWIISFKRFSQTFNVKVFFFLFFWAIKSNT